ncbi:MAG: hypothetical protein WCX27_01025 [Candidatus Paceibacterota bacterium]|jgi:hypothetical protein
MTNSDFIEKQKKIYKSLKPCYCPAINDTVYFNAEGLRHLLYKENRPRNINEKHYRMGLIDHVVETISKSQKATVEIYDDSKAKLWILDWVKIETVFFGFKKKKSIKVILRKIGNGKTHFLSIMCKKI